MLLLFSLFAVTFCQTCEWFGKTGYAPDTSNTSCAPLYATANTNMWVELFPALPSFPSPTAPSLELDFVEVVPVHHAAPVPRTMNPGGKSSKIHVASVELTTTHYSRREVFDMATKKVSIAASYQVDMLVFPETYFIGPYTDACDTNGTTPLCLQWQEETLDFCSEQSATNNMWIICTLYYWKLNRDTKVLEKYNSAFVFNRNGTNLGPYFKMYPVYEMAYGIGNEQLYPGKEGVKVWDTDFGMRVCIFICNDMFFPDIAAQCGSLGAELVVWPAAWKGGRVLEALAMLNNFWIVNAPGPAQFGKAYVVDNVGRVVEEADFVYMDPNMKIVQIETEQVVLHNNFQGRVNQMMKDHPQVVIQEYESLSEITILRPDTSLPGYPVRALLRQYNVPTIRELAEWMRKHINELRMNGKIIPADNPIFPSPPNKY